MSKSVRKILGLFRKKHKGEVSLGRRISSIYGEKDNRTSENDSKQLSDSSQDILNEDAWPTEEPSTEEVALAFTKKDYSEFEEIDNKPGLSVLIWHGAKSKGRIKGYKHAIAKSLSTGLPGHATLVFDLPDTSENQELASSLNELGIYSHRAIGHVSAMKKGIPYSIEVPRIRVDFTFWPGRKGEKFDPLRRLEDDWKEESPYKRQYKEETGMPFSTIHHETEAVKVLQRNLKAIKITYNKLEQLRENYLNSLKIAMRSEVPDADCTKELKRNKKALFEFLVDNNLIKENEVKKCKKDDDALTEFVSSMLEELKMNIATFENTIQSKNRSEGIPPSHTIFLPISFDDDEDALYALDGHAMIEKLQQIVEESSFNLLVNNCSKTSLQVLLAGVSEDMKAVFSDLEGQELDGKPIKIGSKFYKPGKIVSPTEVKDFSLKLSTLITLANSRYPKQSSGIGHSS